MNKALIESFLNEVCGKAEYVGEIFDITPSDLLKRFIDYCEKYGEPATKLKVDMAFVGTLRDRLMAIPIREYFVPNRRKAIMDELIKKFNEQGVEVIGVEKG